MGIAIQIVKEDLGTVISYRGGIDINDDYYQMRNVAREMNLVLISTIDDSGDTIINQPQLEIFKKEILQLRARADVNQAVVDVLQQAADAITPYSCEYLKFIGD